MVERSKRVFKNILDRLVASFVLALLAPVLVLIGLGLKMSGINPIFTQDLRVGLNRRRFLLIKFNVFNDSAGREKRSVNEYDSKLHADVPFSRIGWFLRKSRLEDLPQFLNVLVGDMALIGPCPDRVNFCDLYGHDVSGYEERFKIKPGITGWAQIKGLRDDGRDQWAPSLKTIEKRHRLDQYYIGHRSLFLDCRIMLHSFLALMFPRPLGEEGKIQKVYRTFLDTRAVQNEKEKKRLIEELDNCSSPTIVSFLNAHGFNVAWSEQDFLKSLSQSDILLRDGIGMKIAMRIFGRSAGFNMNGTDLIPSFLERHKDKKVAILGTCDPWLQQACDKLREDGIDVVWSDHGFHPIDYYANEITQYKPDLVVLAMGMPKQEHVAVALKNALTQPVLILSGGAIIDFIAGRVSRAPRIVRTMGMEWVYRWILEPRRLFFRYVFGNPLFLYRVMLMRCRQGFIEFRANVLGTFESPGLDTSGSPHPENV